MRSCFVILLAALVGCSETSDCGPTSPQVCESNRSLASHVAGGWLETGTANGMRFRMDLSAHDTTLMGTGTYSTDAGGSGTVDITGFVFWRDSYFAPNGHEIPATSNVVLGLTLDSGRTAQLDQAFLMAADTLFAAITFADGNNFTTYVTTFVRTTSP